MSDKSDDDDRAVELRRARTKRRKSLRPEGEIGARLRELYGEFEREPIPAQLIELLERLDQAEPKAGK